MLWLVTVETVTPDGSIDHYDTVVLAHSERGARSAATRGVSSRVVSSINEPGPGAHSIEAKALDVRETGVVLITKRHELPIFTRETTYGW